MNPLKKPKIIRPVKLTTNLPEDVRAKLDLHLYSEVEGRVPFGAYQRFLVERIQEFFSERRTYLTEEERLVVRRILAETLPKGDEEWPQETWQKHFSNGSSAYLVARQLVDKLR